MMKCPYCGSPLDLDDNFCSHCGKLNEQVRQHVNDMNRYQSEFNETREEVYETTRRYKGTSVRVVVIAILLILNVIAAIVLGQSYSIIRSIRQSESERHYKEYSALLDGYLEAGDYHAFSAFMQEHYIYCYDSKYESYGQIKDVAYQYVTVYEYLMGAVVTENEYFKEMNSKNLSGSLSYYYQTQNPERYSYIEGIDRELYVNAIADMNSRIEQMLVSYCHISPEDAACFVEYSDAKRAILLEEGMKHVNE